MPGANKAPSVESEGCAVTVSESPVSMTHEQ